MDTQILPPFGYTNRVSVRGKHSRILRCSDCRFSTRNERGMSRHVAVEHIFYQPYMCPVISCGESRYSRRELVEHICVKKHGEVTEFHYKDDVAKRRLLTTKLKEIFSINHSEAEEITHYDGISVENNWNSESHTTSYVCSNTDERSVSHFTSHIADWDKTADLNSQFEQFPISEHLVESPRKIPGTSSNQPSQMKHEETPLAYVAEVGMSSRRTRKRHPVWLHYDTTEHPDINRCRLCGKHIRGKFTTNLMLHLKHKHNELYQLLLRQRKSGVNDARIASTEQSSTTAIANQHFPPFEGTF